MKDTFTFFHPRRVFGLSFVLALILMFSLSSCGSSSRERVFETPQGRQLLEQIQRSSVDIKSYEKRFEDLSQRDADDRMMLKVEDAGRDSLTQRIQQDLAYLYDIYYKDPAVVDLMDTLYVQDTLIARVQEENKGKSKLRQQKILKGPEGELRFASSYIHESNWLYDLSISIEVDFDSLGRYRRHQLYLLNEVHLLGEAVESRIYAKANY